MPDQMADLRQQAATLDGEIKSIYARVAAEKRVLTTEESSALKLKEDAFNPMVTTIKRYDEHTAASDQLQGPIRTEGPAAAIENQDAGSRIIRVGAPREAGRPFTSLGDQLLAVRAASNMGGSIDKRLLRLNEEIRAASGMSEAVPSDGGFAVQSDFATNIIGRIFDESSGSLASRVQRIEIGANANGLRQNVIDESSRVNGSRWGGVQAYWAAEADTVTATKPKLRRMEMDLEKLFAIWYLTEELQQDSTAMSSIAETAFAEEIQFKVEDGVVNGSGTGQMLGILNGGATTSVAIEGSQTIANTAGSIAINTAKMLARFIGQRSRAVWLANIELFPKLAVATLSAATAPVYLPNGNIAGAPFGTLWGIPVVFCEYCAAEGTVGDIILADLGWYALIAKGAPQFAMSMHVRFLYDENAFRVTFRCNGQPIPNAPITGYKMSTGLTRSPFVTLAARS